MSISGFKIGDRVLTPGNHRGTIVAIADLWASVRYDKLINGKPDNTFRMAALRPMDAAHETSAFNRIDAVLAGKPAVTSSHKASTDTRNPAYNLLKAAERIVELIEENDADRWDVIASHREALESLKTAIEAMR